MLTYRKGQVIGGRPGELKLKKIDPKQLPRIQLKLNVITGPIAQEIRRSYTAGECSAVQAMVQMIAVRVTTARQLMHRKPEGRSNRAHERGPDRSREQVRIFCRAMLWFCDVFVPGAACRAVSMSRAASCCCILSPQNSASSLHFSALSGHLI